MYESKVSSVKSEAWDNFSVMKNSNIKSPGFIPVPCPTHSDYSITNICKSPGCIQPLCPQCITAHVQLHQHTKKPAKIENIITTRMSCIQKLAGLLQQLNVQYQKYEKSCGANLQSFLQKNRKKIEFAKNKIVNFVQKYFQEIQEKLQVLEVAYFSQRQKKSKQMKTKAAPLLTHMQEISQYKTELQSEDYIPALIELLNDPPKKPQTLGKLQFQDFGEVKIDEYSFENFKTSLQSFVSVQSLFPQQNKFSQQINRNSTKFSNQMQFSRLGRSSSRQLIESHLQNSRNQVNSERSNSRKKIFSNEKKDNFSQVYNSRARLSSVQKTRDVGNVILSFETIFQEVGLIDKNYFMYDKGILAYFPQAVRYFYAVDALCADTGFQRFELSQDFVIPFGSQCIIIPASRVFLIGGQTSTKYSSDCYEIVINPSRIREAIIKRLTPMKQARAKFGSVFYKQHIYVFGGKRDKQLLSTCERYNYQTDKWQTLKNMPEALMSMNVCVFNDKIVKFGGIQQNSQILNRIDLFYPDTGNWVKFASEIPFFIKMGSCQINKTQMLIFGGETQFSKQRNQCFLLREQYKNELKLYPCSNSLYNEGSFQNSYVYKNSLLAIQNGQGGKNKIIMKLQNGKWRFLSC